ncbi:MAG: hypothetical protein RIR59_1051 [Pseudomonadota bacterium]
MTDTPANRPSASRLTGSLKGLVYFAVAAFVAGMAILAWTLLRSQPGDSLSPTAPSVLPAPAASSSGPAVTPKAPLTLGEAELRMAALEARLAEADRMSGKALDDARRAERLLILVATRRAVDRGLALTYLESLLDQQFGRVYPRDVAQIIAHARQPVTLDQLTEELGLIRADLTLPPGSGGWIDTVVNDLRGLATVRRADQPSEAPAKKLERARRAMARDQVDIAVKEIAALPGAPKAQDWLTKARRYVAVRAALDRLEAATLLNPQPEAPAPAANIATGPSAGR